MAKLTKEQVEDINQKCSNDFMLDVGAFMYHGDKQVVKYIDIGDDKKLSATLSFRDRRIGYTFKPVLSLHLAIWNVEPSGLMCSHGLGVTIDLSEPYERRKFSDIIAKTKDFDNEKCLQLASEHMEQLKNPFLVG